MSFLLHKIKCLERRVEESRREKQDLVEEIQRMEDQIRERELWKSDIVSHWEKDREALVHALRKYGTLLDDYQDLRQRNANLHAENTALKLNQVILLSEGEREYLANETGIPREDMEEFLESLNRAREAYAKFRQ